MADEVKKDAETASAQGEVKKTDVDASATKDDKDFDISLAEELAKSLEREVKLTEERDNYKEGMLKAKGKSKGDDDSDEGKEASSTTELVGVVKQVLRRNQELEKALLSKTQMSNTGQGGNADGQAKVGDNMLSEAQIGALKQRGWDDKKIALFKQNLQKART